VTNREEIRQCIEKLLHRSNDHKPFSDTDSLILSGRLESIDTIEIVMFLEQRFGIDFGDIGFDETEFDSVQRIDDLVQAHAPASLRDKAL